MRNIHLTYFEKTQITKKRENEKCNTEATWNMAKTENHGK